MAMTLLIFIIMRRKITMTIARVFGIFLSKWKQLNIKESNFRMMNYKVI